MGLKKRQNYAKGSSSDYRRQNTPHNSTLSRPNVRQNNYSPSSDTTDKRCYMCGEVGHWAVKCKQGKKESSRPPNTAQATPKSGTKGLKAVKSIENHWTCCTPIQTMRALIVVLVWYV